MREVTRFNIEQYRRERLHSLNGRGGFRAPASVDRELQLLSRIFTLAIERGLITENPCRGIKLCSVGNVVTRYLSGEEEEKLLAVLDTPKRRHLLHITIIGLHTGMRRTEILTLNTRQIDFARNSIELQAHQTKGGRYRTVPISGEIRPLLVELSQRAGKSGYLFENPRTGKPLLDIKKAWASAVKDAGLEPIRFHDVRHTFGTRAIDGGAPLSAVKEVMGHANVQTTMRYVHATDQGKRMAVEAAAKAKSPAPLLHHQRKAAQ
jgi:integrase